MVDPKNVISPKSRLSGPIKVLHDTGADGYSIAAFTWDNRRAVGIRWNGGEDAHEVGNPQSRGLPTWFILPEDIAGIVNQHLDLDVLSSHFAGVVTADGMSEDEFEARIEKVAERVLARLLERRAEG